MLKCIIRVPELQRECRGREGVPPEARSSSATSLRSPSPGWIAPRAALEQGCHSSWTNVKCFECETAIQRRTWIMRCDTCDMNTCSHSYAIVEGSCESNSDQVDEFKRDTVFLQPEDLMRYSTRMTYLEAVMASLECGPMTF